MDKIEVTQADRIAAADAVKAYRDNKNGDWQARIRNGECDDGYMVQAFARHRLAARTDATPVAWMYTHEQRGVRISQHRQDNEIEDGDGWTEIPLYPDPSATDVAALVEAAKDNHFYIDCEFDGHNGPLLSMAIVRDDEYSIHMRIAQEAKDPWVRKNVMPLMEQHNATQSGIVYINDVGGVILAFLGDCKSPVIIADSPVDISRFCQALSTGSDGGWASVDYPQMTFEVHNVDCYPTTLPNAVQHNAWWDAMALRQALAPFTKGQNDE